MGLDFAIDELYATGWSAVDSRGCLHSAGGQVYPSADRVGQEFEAAGFGLTIRRVDMFDCFRAQWQDAHGAASGATVGQSEEEAAVYALAQLRKQTAGVGA